jgi:drug/metabolite transporter (DMT)-like permease
MIKAILGAFFAVLGVYLISTYRSFPAETRGRS